MDVYLRYSLDFTMKNKYSILLPTYNERENILETVKSIFENVTDPTEIIVVDDDSGCWGIHLH